MTDSFPTTEPFPIACAGQHTALPAHEKTASENLDDMDHFFQDKYGQIIPKDLLIGRVGRLEGVVLRLLAGRRLERQHEQPAMWSVFAQLKTPANQAVSAQLFKIKGKAAYIPDRYHAEAIIYDLKEKNFQPKSIKGHELKLLPPDPFCLKDLMIEAASRYAIPAQDVFETVFHLLHFEHRDRKNGLVGLDVAPNLQDIFEQTRALIFQDYGNDYLPWKYSESLLKYSEKKPLLYPVNVDEKPKRMKKYLTPNQNTIYNMIWSRFIASQMRRAKLLERKLYITAGPRQRYIFLAMMREFKFRGFYQVYQPDKNFISRNACLFPHEIMLNRELPLLRAEIKNRFPKARTDYTEAELLAEIRDLGSAAEIAAVVEYLVKKGYAERRGQKILLTQTGLLVGKLILEQCAALTSPAFQSFLRDRQKKHQPIHELLEKIIKRDQNTATIGNAGTCPECGKKIVQRVSRYGKFYACSGFPQCKFTQTPDLDIPCPHYGCEGKVIQRQAKDGRYFYGCTMYPVCTFTSSHKPVNEVCPFCGHPYLICRSAETQIKQCPDCNNTVKTGTDIFC